MALTKAISQGKKQSIGDVVTADAEQQDPEERWREVLVMRAERCHLREDESRLFEGFRAEKDPARAHQMERQNYGEDSTRRERGLRPWGRL